MYATVLPPREANELGGGDRAGRSPEVRRAARLLKGERPSSQGFKASPGPSKESTTDIITQRI